MAAIVALSQPVMACETLRMAAGGTVTTVTDGDTVVLADDTPVRLIGTQAPKLPLGRDGFEAWPLAEEARAALEAIALGRTVRLGFGGEALDRHGRTLAHLFVGEGDDPVWAQQAMVAAGMARVYSFADNRHCLAELYAAEAGARAKKLGIWADPYYHVRVADRPEDILERAGHYELVEGRVLAANAVGNRVYLNFGRHWREDFTVLIERPALRLFEADGLDPLALDGRLIRVRGWVDEWDGPRIEVTHPEQIEVLGAR